MPRPRDMPISIRTQFAHDLRQLRQDPPGRLRLGRHFGGWGGARRLVPRARSRRSNLRPDGNSDRMVGDVTTDDDSQARAAAGPDRTAPRNRGRVPGPVGGEDGPGVRPTLRSYAAMLAVLVAAVGFEAGVFVVAVDVVLVLVEVMNRILVRMMSMIHQYLD